MKLVVPESVRFSLIAPSTMVSPLTFSILLALSISFSQNATAANGLPDAASESSEIAAKAGFKTSKGSIVRWAETGDLNKDNKDDLIVFVSPSKPNFVGAASMSIYLNKGSNEKPKLDLVFSNSKLVRVLSASEGTGGLSHTTKITDNGFQLIGTAKSADSAAGSGGTTTHTLAWDKSGQQFNVSSYKIAAEECSSGSTAPAVAAPGSNAAASASSGSLSETPASAAASSSGSTPATSSVPTQTTERGETAVPAKACKSSETIYDFAKQEITKPDGETCAFNKKVRTPTLEMMAAGQNLISGLDCK